VKKLVDAKPKIDASHPSSDGPSKKGSAAEEAEERRRIRNEKRIENDRENNLRIHQENEALMKKIEALDKESKARLRAKKSTKKKRIKSAKMKLQIAKSKGDLLAKLAALDVMEQASMDTKVHLVHSNRVAARSMRMRREELRLSQENNRIMKRILDTRPTISVKKMERDAEKRSKLLNEMARRARNKFVDMSHITLDAVRKGETKIEELTLLAGAPIAPMSPRRFHQSTRNRAATSHETKRPALEGETSIELYSTPSRPMTPKRALHNRPSQSSSIQNAQLEEVKQILADGVEEIQLKEHVIEDKKLIKEAQLKEEVKEVKQVADEVVNVVQLKKQDRVEQVKQAQDTSKERRPLLLEPVHKLAEDAVSNVLRRYSQPPIIENISNHCETDPILESLFECKSPSTSEVQKRFEDLKNELNSDVSCASSTVDELSIQDGEFEEDDSHYNLLV